jgi:hypothetical protein
MAEREGQQPSGGAKTGGWRTSSPVLPCPHAPASECAYVVARSGTKGARVVTLQMGHKWFNISFNRPFQPNTYWGEFLNYVYLFIFG